MATAVGNQNDCLLQNDFVILPNTKLRYRVSASKYGISYNCISHSSSETAVKVINLGDVVGCRVKPGGHSLWLFTIFWYPFRKTRITRKRTRFRNELTFCTTSERSEEENKRLVEKWRHVILSLSRGLPVKKEDIDNLKTPSFQKLLVLVNPCSGPGRALQIFVKEVKPLLEEAEYPYEAKVTEYAGHACEIIKALDLEEWYGIVIVSGDGLIYEVYNGLMQRSDWTQAIKTPVGCLPGGSGNALCCSINYSAGEPIEPHMALHSSFILVKHKIVPMDLVLLQTPTLQAYSFLSLTWGFVADVDYESERFRNLGEARFTVGAFMRIVSLRSYKARISFLPITDYEPKNRKNRNGVISKLRRFSLHSRSNSRITLNGDDTKSNGSPENPDAIPHASSSNSVINLSYRKTSDVDGINSLSNNNSDIIVNCNNNSSPLLGHNNKNRKISRTDNYHNSSDSQEELSALNISHSSTGTDDIPFPKSCTSHQTEVDSPTAIQTSCSSNSRSTESPNISLSDDIPMANGVSGRSVSNISVHSGNGNSFELNTSSTDENSDEEMITAVKCDGKPVPTTLLAPLDENVPENWVSLEDDFITMVAVYQTHLGSDMMAAPYARLNDGFIHLIMVKSGVPKNALLNLFIEFGEGAHVDSPYVEIVKVLAFRLEPLSDTGNIMIDGERIDNQPIQGQILPGLARVMAIK